MIRARLTPLPDLPTLGIGLSSVFGAVGGAHGSVTVLERQANRYASTFPSEIVSCRLGNGVDVQVVCKYGSGGPGRRAYGHRGGVAYEAAVYRYVLQPLSLSRPRFHG